MFLEDQFQVYGSHASYDDTFFTNSSSDDESSTMSELDLNEHPLSQPDSDISNLSSPFYPDIDLNDLDDGLEEDGLVSPPLSSRYYEHEEPYFFTPDEFDRKYLDQKSEQRLKTLWRFNRQRFWIVYSQLIPQIIDGEEWFSEEGPNYVDSIESADENKIEHVAEQAHAKIKTAKCPKCKTKGRTCGKWKVKEQTACECTRVNYHKRQWQKMKTSVKHGRRQARYEKYTM